jgi:hypothetical protein
VAKVEALILAAAAFDGRSGVGGEFCSTCVRTLGRGCGQKYFKLSEATFCNLETQETCAYSGFAAQRLHPGGVCAEWAGQPRGTSASEQVVSQVSCHP